LSGFGGLAPGILEATYGSIKELLSSAIGEPNCGVVLEIGDGVLILTGVEERGGVGEGECVGVLACDDGIGLAVLIRTETGGYTLGSQPNIIKTQNYKSIFFASIRQT